MRVPAERSPVKVFLLTILTLGLYYLYWLYVTSRDIDDFLGDTELPPIVHLVLFICTGTLWGFAWDFMTARRIQRMQRQVGLAAPDNAIIYLLLDLLGAGPIAGVGIVVPLLEQTSLNEIYRIASGRRL